MSQRDHNEQVGVKEGRRKESSKTKSWDTREGKVLLREKCNVIDVKPIRGSR